MYAKLKFHWPRKKLATHCILRQGNHAVHKPSFPPVNNQQRCRLAKPHIMVDYDASLGAKNKDKVDAFDPTNAAHPFKGIGSCICGYRTRCPDEADHCLEVIKLRDQGYDGRCKAAWGQVKKKGAVDHIIELWEVRAGMFLLLEFAASPSPRHRLTQCAPIQPTSEPCASSSSSTRYSIGLLLQVSQRTRSVSSNSPRPRRKKQVPHPSRPLFMDQRL